MMEIYFVFFFSPTKKEGNFNHIALIVKAIQACAKTKALSKSAIYHPHTDELR